MTTCPRHMVRNSAKIQQGRCKFCTILSGSGSGYFSAPRLLPLPGKSARRCTLCRLATGLARLSQAYTPWRGAGVVERGGLENRCGRKSTEGSNPSLSAIIFI